MWKKTAPGGEDDVDVRKREVKPGAEISMVHRSAVGMIRSKEASRRTEKNMITNKGMTLMAMEEKGLYGLAFFITMGS
jgi:hypothetical protein